MKIGKITKSEWFLLGLTGVFLCGLLILFRQDQLTKNEIELETEVAQEVFMPDVSPLDLNTATAEELARLPGIGEELARRILEYRTANGSFQKPEELLEVSGIGEGKFAALEGRITVSSEVIE